MFRRSSISTKYFQKLCFSSNNDIPSSKNLAIPLSLSRPNQYNKILDMETRISKLTNGLTVATQNQFGLQCTIGVMVKSAPRYEVRHLSGVSQFIEKLGFQSTEDFKNKNEIQTVLDKCGAISDCQLARDLIIYGVSGKTTELENLVNLLSEIVLRPRVTAEEIEVARQVVRYEHQAMRMIPPPDNLMQDLIHQAAFRHNTLGLPRYTPLDNMDIIQRADIVTYMATTFRPESMVLIGVGVDHNDMVNYANKSFVGKTDYLLRDGDIRPEIVGLGPDRSVPQMTGGEVNIKQDLSQYHDPMPEFAHVSLALESCGVKDPQFVPVCLLQTLMGGGGSFSAGGPGKGMYSRLYTEVLNQYHWANSAIATNHSYSDTGLFTVTGSAEPKDIESLVQVLAKQLKNMGKPLSSHEFARAKCQLKSMLLMNLEMRPVVFEDIGRQVLYQGFRNTADHWVEEIAKVTEQDIKDLVQRMLLNKPAMAAFGSLDKLPSLDSVNKLLATSERFIPRVFNKFA